MEREQDKQAPPDQWIGLITTGEFSARGRKGTTRGKRERERERAKPTVMRRALIPEH